MSRIYEYRKKQGLCVNCGEVAASGKTRCIRCAQIEAVKALDRYHHKVHTDAYRDARSQYEKKWRESNPEKMAMYKSRKSEYNRRYNNGI